MSKIEIEGLGFTIPVGNGSSIEKYFSSVLKLTASDGDAAKLKADLRKTLAKVETDDVSVGLTVEQDVDVGNGDVEWTIEGGATTQLRVWNEPGETALGGEDFGTAADVEVGAGEAIVGVQFEGTLSTGLEHALGDLTFGFDAGTTFTAANYRPFGASTRFKRSIEESFGEFRLPGDMKDIESMSEGLVATAAGSGSLKFSVEGEFKTSVNPVTVSAPVIDSGIEINSGFSASFGVEAELLGEFELRVKRLDQRKFLLGYYRADQGRIEISVSGQTGASVSVGGKDLATEILGKLAGEPEVPKDFLTQAGLSDERIKELQTVVDAGIQRKLEASLEIGWERLRMSEAAFLFEVDLDGLRDGGQRAVSSALDGDLRLLTAQRHNGVRLKASVVRDTVKQTNKLRLNLFGVFNYNSIVEMVKVGVTAYDASTGDLIFLDEATASKKKSWVKNTRAVDTEKVSALMMESLVTSHAYNAVRETRTVKVEHFYFRYERKTRRREMKDLFDLPVALDLLDREDADDLAGQQSTGRSALRVEAEYDSAQSASLFFKTRTAADGSTSQVLRARNQYIQTARKALAALEAGDQGDSARMLLGTNDDIYRAVSKAGSHGAVYAKLKTISVDGKPINEALFPVIHGDYLRINSWAQAMTDLGTALRAIQRYEKKHGAPDPEKDNRYRNLRKKLRKQSAKVSKKTGEFLGEPYGLTAMYHTADPKPEIEVQITTDTGVYAYEAA